MAISRGNAWMFCFTVVITQKKWEAVFGTLVYAQEKHPN